MADPLNTQKQLHLIERSLITILHTNLQGTLAWNFLTLFFHKLKIGTYYTYSRIKTYKMLPAVPSMNILANQSVYGKNSWISYIFSHRFLIKTKFDGFTQNTMGFIQNKMGTVGTVQNWQF